MCPCCQQWAPIQQSVIDGLERYRTALGQPVHILSGFRCPKHNAEVGGAPFSRHMMGLAVDHELRDGDRTIWRAALVAIRFFYRVIIYPNRFLHVDQDDSAGFGVVFVTVKIGNKSEYWPLHRFLRDTTAGILLDGIFGKF